MITDTIDGVLIESEEDGFHLILSGAQAEYRFHIHGVALELLRAVDREIRPWQEEAETAERYRTVLENLGAYAPDDPKHPTYHERMSG